MVFAHTFPGKGAINTWIFSFHMPIFFIICGILQQRRGKPDWRKTLSKRVFQLGIPYFIFCLLLVAYYWGTSVFAGVNYAWEDALIKIFTLQGIDSLWFIPCYFVAELAGCLAAQHTNLHNVSIILVLLACFFIRPSDWGNCLLMKFAICYAFVSIGYFLGGKVEKTSISLAFALLIGGSIASYYNGFSAIGSLELNNPLVFFSAATAISVALLSLLRHTNNQALAYYGRNSIVLLCTNNLLIEIVRLADYKISGNFLLRHGLPGALLFTFMLLLIEIPIIYLSNHQLHTLFGKKQSV